MPNYCYNTLIVSSDSNEEIKKFFLENRSFDNQEDEEDSFLSFSKKVPKPDDENDWYNWNCQNWGTKWDAIDVELDNYYLAENTLKKDFEIGPNETELRYTFSTAWGPALVWLDTIAKKYPNLNFMNEYSEGGMDFYGKRLYSDGEITEDFQSSLSEYNWSRVNKDTIIEMIHSRLNIDDDDYDIDCIAEEIIEDYANNEEYFENIHSFVMDEIVKIIDQKENNTNCLTLSYENEGKKLDSIEF